MEKFNFKEAPSSSTKYGTANGGAKAKVPGSSFKIPVTIPMTGPLGRK